MGNSSVAQPVSAQVPNDIAEMLARRAKARGITRSRYLAMILEWWRSQGYPAIDTIDSTARAIVMQEMMSETIDAPNEPGSDSAAPRLGKDVKRDRPRKTA